MDQLQVTTKLTNYTLQTMEETIGIHTININRKLVGTHTERGKKEGLRTFRKKYINFKFTHDLPQEAYFRYTHNKRTNIGYMLRYEVTISHYYTTGIH